MATSATTTTPTRIFNMVEIKRKLKDNGYVVIRNVLTPEEVDSAKEEFYKWKDGIDDLDEIHKKVDPHGIFKHHENGHSRYAWDIRLNKMVQYIFKKVWETEELSVSFDGSCHIPKNCTKRDNIWTHTDQAPNSKGLKCYQGFVALTTNKERTLRVYKGSHELHEQYFKDKKISSSKNWHLIDKVYLQSIQGSHRKLEVQKGSLVLWDSRVFHQNQYGLPNSEERIVQYVCYLPKHHEKNTETQKKKKLKYFEERRTTSHWPYPVTVNGLQPNSWGDASLKIDYSKLVKTDLEDIKDKILKLIN